MELKYIPLLEEKLFVLSEKVKVHLENETKRLDDMEFMIQMINNHAEELVLIKMSINKSNGELTENDFKDVIEYVNQFTNKALPLLK